MINTNPTLITQAKPSMTLAMRFGPSAVLALRKKNGSAAYRKA